MQQVYQFKITLSGSKPPIWRRVLAPSDFSLEKFHKIIQACFDWYECHLYAFEIFNECYDDENPRSLSKKLSALEIGEKDKFEYIYDFGDCWEHIILLEKVLPYNIADDLPVCVAGKRATPPEDCGGIWGYADNLAIVADSSHPEHEEIKEWMGEDLDPEFFDIDKINARLGSLRKNKTKASKVMA